MAQVAHEPVAAVSGGGEPTLERTIGWKQMAFYGLGGMLGAGIYGLIGKAAGEMGNAIWLAFAVSMVAALLTGLSYASIGSRYPRAGGAAYVTQRAYGMPLLTYVVGLAVMCSGLTSIATQSRVVADNLQRLVGLEARAALVLALGFLLLLAAIVFRGIRECMWLNIVCTSIEVLGLAIIIAVGASYWGSANLLETPPGGRQQQYRPAHGDERGRAHLLLLHRLRGHAQRRRGGEEPAAQPADRPDAGDGCRHRHLHRGGDHRRLGRSLARARLRPRAAGRGDGARRTLVPGDRSSSPSPSSRSPTRPSSTT